VTGHFPVATRRFSDYILWSYLTETAVQGAILTKSYGNFGLVIPAGQFASREVQGLLRILSSAWLVDQLANLPGYDPARCGERIATLPQRHGR
jgi:hypothetical protein